MNKDKELRNMNESTNEVIDEVISDVISEVVAKVTDEIVNRVIDKVTDEIVDKVMNKVTHEIVDKVIGKEIDEGIYGELLLEVRPRVITSKEEYTRLLAIAERLSFKECKTPEERALSTLLVFLIESYYYE